MDAWEEQYFGAFFLALGMAQFGWIAHDYSHHSVFESPKVNDFVSRICGWFQGYELMWWKARHNTHHVVTNELENDPDIKTSPLLSYVEKRLNFLQRFQGLYFLPTMALLHLYWRVESWMYCLKRVRRMVPHLLLLASNLLVMQYLFAKTSWGTLLFCLLAKGLMTGLVVFSTHYTMERLPKSPQDLSFFEQSVKTSLNITGPWIFHWFSGYISYQIEHHLFPRMPHTGLVKVRKDVRKICEKHGIDYNEAPFFESVWRNVTELHQNAKKSGD